MSDFKDMIREISRSKNDFENDLINELAEIILEHVREQIQEKASNGLFTYKNENRFISGFCQLRYNEDDYDFYVGRVRNSNLVPYRYTFLNPEEPGYIAENRCYYNHGVYFCQIVEENIEAHEDNEPLGDNIYPRMLNISEQERKLRNRLSELASCDDIIIKGYYLVTEYNIPNYHHEPVQHLFGDEKISILKPQKDGVHVCIIYGYEFEY